MSSASSAAKKKQDEKNLQLLKALAALAFNKQCFDCGQKGPCTYVNLTIGSFICMSCSGLLRGLNPPHRVKSITMSTFTDDEIEFIKSRGNFFCREVWLGNFDSGRAPTIDMHNDQNKKDFMGIKYERRQWYVEPSPGLFQEAKALTDSGLANAEAANQPQTRPGRSFSGANPVAPTAAAMMQNNGTQSASRISNLPMPIEVANQNPIRAHSPLQTPFQTQFAAPQAAAPVHQPQQIISLFDDDFDDAAVKKQQQAPPQQPPPVQQQQVPVNNGNSFNNAFAPPQSQPPPQQQQQQQQSAATASFPVNFSNMEPTPFTKAAQIQQQQQQQQQQQLSPNNGFKNGSAAAANSGSGFADFDSAFGGANASKPSAPAPIIMAPPPDRYKALEELDDLLTLTGSTGVVSSGIDWGIQQQQQQQRPSQVVNPPQHKIQQQLNFGGQINNNNNINNDPFNTTNVFAAHGMAPPPPPAYSAQAPFGHALPQTQPFPAAAAASGFAAFGQPQQQQQQQNFMPHSASNPFLSAAAAPPQQQQPFFGGAAQQQQQANFFASPFGQFGAPQQPQQPFGAFSTQQQPAPMMRPSASSNNPFLFN